MDESTSRGRSARTPDFSLTNEDLREVAAFAAAAAAEVLPIFEAQLPDDDRPRQAVCAALTAAQGAPRSKLQRVTAPAAHRAAKTAPTLAGFHAAMSAGDAAASVFLHPLADVAQINHILRSAAHAARAKELECTAEQDAAQQTLERAAKRATPALLSILARYPATSLGTTRVTELVHLLDTALRAQRGSAE